MSDILNISVVSQSRTRQNDICRELNAIGMKIAGCYVLSGEDYSLNADTILVDLTSFSEYSLAMEDKLYEIIDQYDIPVFFDEIPNLICKRWALKLADKLSFIVQTTGGEAFSTPPVRLAVASNMEHEISRLASIFKKIGLEVVVHTGLDDALFDNLSNVDAVLIDLREIDDSNDVFLDNFIEKVMTSVDLPVYFDESRGSIEERAVKLAEKLTDIPANKLIKQLKNNQQSEPVSLAIMFADICGSTNLYESLGDFHAQRLISECIEFLKETTQHHKGIVIKTIGDEVMCTFPNSDLAIDAALTMQREIIKTIVLDKKEYSIIGIRIGVHYGNVMMEADDVFGDTVNVAARMAALAKSDQIITTGQTVESLSPMSSIHYRHIERANVRGKKQQFDIHEVLSAKEFKFDATVRAEHKIIAKDHAKLQLIFNDIEIVLDHMHPKITIGRSEKNDIIIFANLISRFHARIEYYRGKFILYDQSFNGTFLMNNEGEESFIHRDNIQLGNKGVMSFGDVVKTKTELLYYELT